MVELVDINTNVTDSTKYIIKLLRGNKMIVTKEWLKSSNVTDIGSIPISPEDYIYKSKNLTQEKKWEYHVSRIVITFTTWIKIPEWEFISPPPQIHV